MHAMINIKLIVEEHANFRSHINPLNPAASDTCRRNVPYQKTPPPFSGVTSMYMCVCMCVCVCVCVCVCPQHAADDADKACHTKGIKY